MRIWLLLAALSSPVAAYELENDQVLRYYRYTQLSCAALVVFTLILWLLHLLQLDHTPLYMLLFYSLLVSPACFFGIYRLQQKIRIKSTELQHLNALVQDFLPSD